MPGLGHIPIQGLSGRLFVSVMGYDFARVGGEPQIGKKQAARKIPGRCGELYPLKARVKETAGPQAGKNDGFGPEKGVSKRNAE